MLDTMRRNVRRLSWTLWLVIAAFIILYFPDFFAGDSATDTVARVNGEAISLREFRSALSEQVDYYRSLNQGQLPDDFIQQMQLGNVVLEQLIRRRLIVEAARDQGFAIAPQEIRDQLMQYPVFTDTEGRWVGLEEYRRVLAANGIDQTAFERQVVEDLLASRVTDLITEGIEVSDEQLREVFQRQNERLRFEFVQVRPTAFAIEVRDEIDDASLQARYDADPEAYRLPERRRVSYALVDTEALRDTADVDPAAVRAEYDANIAQYTTDEQVKARQILISKPAGAAEAELEEARAAAEAALARVRAGEAFDAVAQEVSDDPSSAVGGDLGWVTRGRQVEGWDEAAFALQAGDVSEVTETPFGFVVIQVEERRDARVQPFEEVSAQLEQRLAWETAEDRAAELAEAIRAEVLGGTSLEDVAANYDLSVEQSPLFAQTEGFGEYVSLEFTGRTFGLGQGRVAEPLRVRRGYLVFRLDEISAAHLPEFDVVVEQVREAEIEERSRARAEERAAEFVARLESGEGLPAIAEEAGAVVDSSDLVTRDDVVPVIGRSAALMEKLFATDAGGAGGPVAVNDRFVVFQVTEHEQPDWSLFATQLDDLRMQETTRQRNRLFEGFVSSLRERYTVTVNQELVDTVVG